MKGKRVVAFCLAAVMLATQYSELIALAAPRANVDEISKIEFVKQQGDDPDTTKTTVLSGGSTNMKVTMKKGYTEADPAFTVTEGTTSVTSGIVVSNASALDNKVKRIEVADTYPTTGNKVTVSIIGNYYANKATGSVVETSPDKRNFAPTVQSTQEAAIQGFGTITLKCETGETKNQGPSLVVDGTPTGIFKDFTAANTTVTARRTKPGDTKSPLQLSLFLKAGTGKEMTFQLTPEATYDYYVAPGDNSKYVDENGNPIPDTELNDDGNPITTSPNSRIRKDTTFQLRFNLPQSNPVWLTVIKPQTAVDELAKEIKDSGEKEDTFIRLAAGDDLDYLTKDFEVRKFINRYNAKFNIVWDETATTDGKNWKWVPDDPAHKDNLLINGSPNDEWVKAGVRREKEDIKGKLVYHVLYQKDGTTLTKKEEIPVIIRGTGDVSVVTKKAKYEYDAASADGVKKTDFTDDKDKVLSGNPPTIKMDVYQGGVPNFDNPTQPFQYDLNFDMGNGNGKAEYVIVKATSGDGEVVSCQAEYNGNIEDYKLGSQYANPNPNGGTSTQATFSLLAKKAGEVTLTFEFYTKGNKGAIILNPSTPQRLRVQVVDTSPDEDATLSELLMKNQADETIDFGFKPDATSVFELEVPYKNESVTLKPTRNKNSANKMIEYKAYYRDDSNQVVKIYPKDGADEYAKVESGKVTEKIQLMENIPVTVEVRVTAQNPSIQKTYTLEITRKPASTDAYLEKMGLYGEEDANKKNNYVQGFDSKVLEHNVIVPYKSDWLRVDTLVSKNALAATEPPLESKTLWGTKEWIRMKDLKDDDEDGISQLTVKVFSESTVCNTPDFDENTTRPDKVYIFNIKRADPSEKSALKDLKVADIDEKELKLNAAFSPSKYNYRLVVDYAVKVLRFSVTPEDKSVSRVLVACSRDNHDDYHFKKLLGTDICMELKTDGSYSKELPVDFTRPGGEFTTDDLMIIVVSEAGHAETNEDLVKAARTGIYDEKKMSVYNLEVERGEPSEDSEMKDLVIKNQDGDVEKTFAFAPDLYKYDITVPYESKKISFTPTPNQENARVTVKTSKDMLPREYKLDSNVESRLFELKDYPSVTTFTFVVYSQACEEYGEKDSRYYTTYTVNVTREAPSDDARLKNLVVSGVDKLSPVFVSNKYSYETNMLEGVNTTTLTPTANQKNAIIRVNGNVVDSGTASDPIDIIEEEQEVEIEVTAQDGVTKKVYKVLFYNENLVEKTDNADLKDLKVNYGLMTPKFKPSTTEYEVAVVEDTYSVDIIPKLSDRNAEMKVFWGSKEIGDHNGDYSQALEDGENEFSIEVTPSDGSESKVYTIMVYRNEEDKMKNLTPLEAEDIDFEVSDDVIIVQIDEYPRIGASVFNELKEYPEKTIIFQGNDYSLEISAADLKRVIPQTEIYDFRMTFNPPDEEIDAIDDIMEGGSYNDDLWDDMVMMYFPHHGSLPAPATLHVSLGRKYRNDTLYWHYHNAERERIDYYQELETNTGGNFTVQIDHFSTYIITTGRIRGSERKDGANASDLIGTTVGRPTGSGDKLNPWTGTPEEGQ